MNYGEALNWLDAAATDLNAARTSMRGNRKTNQIVDQLNDAKGDIDRAIEALEEEGPDDDGDQ